MNARIYRFAIPAWIGLVPFLVAACAGDSGGPSVPESPESVGDLSAIGISETIVLVGWTAPSWEGGPVSGYDLRMSQEPISAEEFHDARPVPLDGRIEPPGTPQSVVVEGLGTGGIYYFRMKTQGEEDDWSTVSNQASTVCLDHLPPEAPTDFSGGSASPGEATLRWSTPPDPFDSGRAWIYDLRYGWEPLIESNWADGIRIEVHDPPEAPEVPDSTIVDSLLHETLYHFGLRVADRNMNWSPIAASGPVMVLRDPPVKEFSIQSFSFDHSHFRFLAPSGEGGWYAYPLNSLGSERFILKISPDGRLLGEFQIDGESALMGLAHDPMGAYMLLRGWPSASAGGDSLFVEFYDATGSRQDSITLQFPEVFTWDTPPILKATDSGRLIVNVNLKRSLKKIPLLTVFDRQGSLQASWEVEIRHDMLWPSLTSFDIDDQDVIHVATRGDRLDRYSLDGVYLGAILPSDGELFGYIALDDDGNIFTSGFNYWSALKVYNQEGWLLATAPAYNLMEVGYHQGRVFGLEMDGWRLIIRVFLP